MKEEIKKIMEQSYYYTDHNSKDRNIDQILDLIIKSLPEAKIQNVKKGKYGITQDGEGKTYYFPGHAQVKGFNLCLEEIKNKLRN